MFADVRRDVLELFVEAASLGVEKRRDGFLFFRAPSRTREERRETRHAIQRYQAWLRSQRPRPIRPEPLPVIHGVCAACGAPTELRAGRATPQHLSYTGRCVVVR